MNIDMLWSTLMANPNLVNPEGTYEWLRRQKHSPLARRLIGIDSGPINRLQWGQLCRRWREDLGIAPTALEIVALAAAELSIVEIVHPEDVLSLSRERSPFNHAFFQFEDLVDVWHEVIRRDCGALEPPGRETLDHLFGLTALSLVMRAGVLDPKRLLAVVSALVEGSILRLDMGLHPALIGSDAAGGCTFRVYPDSVTDALCARVFNHPNGEGKKIAGKLLSEVHLHQLIVARMKAHGVPKPNLPTSLGRLLYFASSSLRVFSQPLCLEHAFGSVNSEPFSPMCSTSWECGHSRVRVVDSLLPKAAIRDRQKFPKIPWLTDLGVAIRAFRKEDRSALDHLPTQIEFKKFLPRLILHFATHLLENRSNAKRTLKPITIYYQTRIIAQALSLNPIEALMSEADARAFQVSLEVFDRDLESLHQRVRLRKALHNFREFCPAARDAKLLAFSDDSGPNAIVIGETEFQNARRILRRTLLLAKMPAWQIDEIEMLACLSYRLGLRTSEAWFLELKDIHRSRGELDIIIRSNRRYTLKKTTSERKLPAGVLMPKDERELLERLYLDRKESGLPNDKLIRMECAKDTASRKIAGALKLAARNNLAVQRHLRHSFGTWLLVRLVEISSETSKVREFFPSGVIPPPLPKEAWPRLVRGKTAPTRNLLFVMKDTMGHVTWTTTLRNYIHCMDQIWADSAMRALAARTGESNGMLAAASGLGTSTAYRLLQSSGTAEVLRKVWKQPTKLPAPAANDATSSDEFLALDAIAGAIALQQISSVSATEAAKLFDVTEAAVKSGLELLKPSRKLKPPSEPAWEEAFNLAQRYFSLTSSERAAVREGFRCYMRRKRSRGALAVFTNGDQLPELQSVVDAFSTMNLELDYILFSSQQRKVSSPPAWAGRIFQSAVSVQKLVATNTKAPSATNWLGIRPRHFRATDRQSFAQALRYFGNLSQLDRPKFA